MACALSSAKNHGCIDCAELFVFLEGSGQKCPPLSFPSAPPPGWYGDPSSELSEPLEQTSVVGFSYSIVGHDVLSSLLDELFKDLGQVSLILLFLLSRQAPCRCSEMTSSRSE